MRLTRINGMSARLAQGRPGGEAITMTIARGCSFKKAMLLLTLGLLLCTFSVFAVQYAPVSVPKDAKCPVCGMFVAKFPDWSASIVYRDGTKIYFDGPKDLLKYYLNPRKYDPAKKRADIAFVGVKDYYSLAVIDGRQAYFVVGSNVYGPMGKEPIPFAKKSDAEGFQMDHQGRKPIRFNEITPELLKMLE